MSGTVPDAQTTATVTMTGVLGDQAVTGGRFAETITPPGATCSYSMTGKYVSTT